MLLASCSVNVPPPPMTVLYLSSAHCQQSNVYVNFSTINIGWFESYTMLLSANSWRRITSGGRAVINAIFEDAGNSEVTHLHIFFNLQCKVELLHFFQYKHKYNQYLINCLLEEGGCYTDMLALLVSHHA